MAVSYLTEKLKERVANVERISRMVAEDWVFQYHLGWCMGFVEAMHDAKLMTDNGYTYWRMKLNGCEADFIKNTAEREGRHKAEDIEGMLCAQEGNGGCYSHSD